MSVCERKLGNLGGHLCEKKKYTEKERGRGEEGDGEIKQVLFTDDTMLVAETRNHIQYIVNKFEMGCGRMRLKINVGKSKMLEVNKDQRRSGEKVWVNWEEM